MFPTTVKNFQILLISSYCIFENRNYASFSTAIGTVCTNIYTLSLYSLNKIFCLHMFLVVSVKEIGMLNEKKFLKD